VVLIWFGWFGFNGGSAINASMRAMVAAFNTQVAASTGAIGWVTVDYIKHKRKFSVVGACEGVVAGLVGITPGAGYVSPWCAAAIGFLTAVIIACLQNFNKWIKIDDGLEVFKLHGIGTYSSPHKDSSGAVLACILAGFGWKTWTMSRLRTSVLV
jgi:ammonium transporter, Amt family